MNDVQIGIIKQRILENNATWEIMHRQAQYLPYGSPERIIQEARVKDLMTRSKTLQTELEGLEKS